MKKWTLALACAILALGMIATASAQEEGLLDKSEFNVALNWMSISDANITAAQAGFGKYVTPNVEIGLTGQLLDLDGSNIWAVTPGVSYSFFSDSTTNLVPSIGLGWAFVGGEGDNDNGLELDLGLKVFLNGNYTDSSTAFFVKYQYINDVFGENINIVSLGISKFF